MIYDKFFNTIELQFISKLFIFSKAYIKLTHILAVKLFSDDSQMTQSRREQMA